jgi:hypothetical protein
MIGTEKSIQYATAILEGARKYLTWLRDSDRMVDYATDRIAAIDLILAVERGDHAEAMRLMEAYDIPGWVAGSYCVAKRDPKSATGWSRDDLDSLDEAVVVASNVIDVLKGDYYAAKEKGLI